MHWNTASCSAILLKEKVSYSAIPLFRVLVSPIKHLHTYMITLKDLQNQHVNKPEVYGINILMTPPKD